MPTDPTVEEVRELLTRAELCLHDGVSWAGPSIEIVAALCRHVLASPLTAGEFAGQSLAFIKSLENGYRVGAKHLKGIGGSTAAESRDRMLLLVTAYEECVAGITKLAAEHNVTIVEPKKP